MKKIEWKKGMLVKRGAEAELIAVEFLGKKALRKTRIAKGYREKELDEKIRTERTRNEARIIAKAKEFGIITPVLHQVDLKEKKIIMEFLEGVLLKEYLSEKNQSVMKEFGKIVGKMHSNNLIHGDLTTSNAIVIGKSLAIIDFGLSFNSSKLEDKAVDLVALKKSYSATHSKLEKGWKEFLRGYLETAQNTGIASKMEEIEKRARYA